MSEPYLAVLVPAYNEAERLPKTLARLHEYLSGQAYTWSVTVISDGSTDNTVAVVKDFAAQHPGFMVIESTPNRGKGYVIRTGMREIEGQYRLFSDADLAAPIEEIEKLLPKMAEGYDIAIGSRPLKESRLEIRQPKYREYAGRAFNKVVQMLAIRGIQDTQCGFKVFSAKAAEDVFSLCTLDGFSYDFEALMIGRDLGFRIAEVPIRWAHQEGSKVKFLRDGSRMLVDLVRLRLRGKKGRLGERS